MANPQQNVTISAPGFWGLNLEDAPIDMDQRYALEADNAVIDSFGRLGARKGFTPFLASSPDATMAVRSLGRVVDNGVVRYLAAVTGVNGNKIWEITSLNANPAATELTLPAGISIADADTVQFIDFASYGIILTGDEMMYIFDGVLSRVSDHPSWIEPQEASPLLTGTFNPTTGTAAYGRLWLSGGNLGEESIHYSSLNNPFWWYDGSAVPAEPLNTGGLIDVYESWPSGRDTIVDIVGHNNMLVVFGRNSLLVYGNPQGDPAAQGGIYLADTVNNIGMVNAQALASDGRDLLFVDDTGLRSLGRTIQEQSAALGDLSRTVRTQVQRVISNAFSTGATIKLTYDPTQSFVLMIVSGDDDVWCFDTRQPMQDGSYRVTRWPAAPIACGLYIDTEELLLLGSTKTDILLSYDGLVDFYTQPYNFNYTSPALSFGDPVRTKMVKQIDYTVVSGAAESQAKGSWEYAGIRPYEKAGYFRLLGGDPSYYNSTDFQYGDDATYGSGTTVIRSYKLNADGSGENVLIKFTASINNSRCSLQQINIQSLIGRIN